MKRLFNTLDECIALLEVAMSLGQLAEVDSVCQRLSIDRREFFRRSWLHLAAAGNNGR